MKLLVFIVLITHIVRVITTTLNNNNDSSSQQQLYIFPENITIFNVRKDRYTSQEVSRGRLNELG